MIPSWDFFVRGTGQGFISDTDNLPYGWKKSPPIFFMATEIVADLANAALRCNTPIFPHRLDDIAESIVKEEPPTLQWALVGFTRDPYLRRANSNPSAYVEFFVTGFLGLAQGLTHRQRQVQKTLFHSLDNLFCTFDSVDSDKRK